jgi:hypothetical protein
MRCGESDYASLARCTQYAHFTPEFIVRAMWSGPQRLGWRGGRVLEPGIGTGLFPALMPEELRDRSHVTGVELDPCHRAYCPAAAARGAYRHRRFRPHRPAGASISPSAIHPSPIAPFVRTGPIVRSVCDCTTISSRDRSIS